MSGIKDRSVFLIFSLVLGLLCGAVVWIFISLMNLGIDFLWDHIPGQIEFPYYTLCVCVIGGTLLGIMHHFWGDVPESLEVILDEIKSKKSYRYDNIFQVTLTALTALVFGASIGPEAGLAGIIVGLCCFVADRFKSLHQEYQDLATIGFSTALTVVFHSPLFGFIEPIENEGTAIPKKAKTVLYFTTLLSAFGIFLFLKENIPLPAGSITPLEGISISTREYIFLIPLALIGYVFWFLYAVFNKFILIILKPLKNKLVLKSLIGGIVLGLLGTALPFTMYSGEEQIGQIASQWQEMGAVLLLLTGISKLFLTPFCINSGLKGGQFFPTIFAGISLGYAFSIFFDINPVFACAVLATSLLSSMLSKPIATVLLMLLVFPFDSIFVMLIAAVIGTLIPKPRFAENGN